MENDRLPKIIMEWETEGRRREGRPLGTWMDGVRNSMEKYGLRVEDERIEKNGDERFSSRSSCLYCFINIACILIAVFGQGIPQQ
jgi:hypothetical protein